MWPRPSVRKRLRSQLALSGALGVLGGAALIGGAVFLSQRTGLKPLVTGWGIWLLFGFLLLFSLAEIPLMVFGMRRLTRRAFAGWLAALTNAAFTFFAALYAAPLILLTGRVWVGVALAGLGLVRFVSALWFVPDNQNLEPATDLSSSNR